MIENYVKTILKLYEQHIKDYCQDKIDMIIECGKEEFIIETRVCLLLRDEKTMHFLIAIRLYFCALKGQMKSQKNRIRC